MSEFRRSLRYSELRHASEPLQESKEGKERRLLEAIESAQNDETLIPAILAAIDANVSSINVKRAIKRHFTSNDREADSKRLSGTNTDLRTSLKYRPELGSDVVPEGLREYTFKLLAASPQAVTTLLGIFTELENSEAQILPASVGQTITATARVLTDEERERIEIGKKFGDIIANATSREEGAKALMKLADEYDKKRK